MESNNNTEIMIPSESSTMISDFTGGAPAFFCSFTPSTDAEKRQLYNAMNNADVQLSDHIGQVINMRDIIIEPVEIVNEETGEAQTAPRCIIIDVDGNTYSCVSKGIYNALHRLCTIFGKPSWRDGLPVKVRQISRGSRRLFTLDATIM